MLTDFSNNFILGAISKVTLPKISAPDDVTYRQLFIAAFLFIG
jgi:hypothetical protein